MLMNCLKSLELKWTLAANNLNLAIKNPSYIETQALLTQAETAILRQDKFAFSMIHSLSSSYFDTGDPLSRLFSAVWAIVLLS
jgi:hypothetical protein